MICQEVKQQIDNICEQLGIEWKITEQYSKIVKFAVRSKQPGDWFSTEITQLGANTDALNANLLNYFTHAHNASVMGKKTPFYGN